MSELAATADHRDIVRRKKAEHEAEIIEYLCATLSDDGFDEFQLLAALGVLADKRPEFFLTAKEVRQGIKRRWAMTKKATTP